MARVGRGGGFTLLELMVVIGLLALLLGIGYVSMQPAHQAAQTRAEAEQLAQHLRAARQQAMASRTPVAIAFPSNDGSVPHTQSFYILKGRAPAPAVTRVVRLNTDYPSAYIVVGHWNLASGSNSDTPPDLASNSSSLTVSSWGVPYSADPVFCFTPSGTVATNDQVLFEGAYHILVSSGLDYQAQSVGSTRSFDVTRVCKPQTITITPAGEVSVSSGILDGTSAVAEQNTFVSPPAPGAPPPLPAQPPDTAPSLSVTVTPTAASGLLPSGVAAAIPPQGYAVLHLSATDPQGKPLRASCTCPAQTGRFSHQGSGLADWDPSTGKYLSTWIWRPNRAVSGNVTLTCKVTDARGLSATVNRTIEVGAPLGMPNGRIAFSAYIDSTSYPNIYEIFPGWADPVRLTDDSVGDTEPVFSPDGTKIAFLRGTQVWVMNADGSDQHAVFTAGPGGIHENGPGGDLCWSPWGNQLAFAAATPGPAGDINIYVVALDGSGLAPLTTGLQFPTPEPVPPGSPWVNTQPWVQPAPSPSPAPTPWTDGPGNVFSFTWSPDGKWIAFSSLAIDPNQPTLYRATAASSLYKIKLKRTTTGAVEQTGACQILTGYPQTGSADDFKPAWRPKGNNAIAFDRGSAGGPTSAKIDEIDPDATVLPTTSSGTIRPSSGGYLNWSPDGKWLVFDQQPPSGIQLQAVNVGTGQSYTIFSYTGTGSDAKPTWGLSP